MPDAGPRASQRRRPQADPLSAKAFGVVSLSLFPPVLPVCWAATGSRDTPPSFLPRPLSLSLSLSRRAGMQTDTVGSLWPLALARVVPRAPTLVRHAPAREAGNGTGGLDGSRACQLVTLIPSRRRRTQHKWRSRGDTLERGCGRRSTGTGGRVVFMLGNWSCVGAGDLRLNMGVAAGGGDLHSHESSTGSSGTSPRLGSPTPHSGGAEAQGSR